MYGNTILILPFGLLPILLIVAYIFFFAAEAGVEKNIASKLREGITEYPTAVSLLLYGDNENEIEFTVDGKGVVLTIESPKHIDISDPASVKEYFRERLRERLARCDDEIDQDLVDHHVIEDIVQNRDAGTLRMTVSLPDRIVLSEKYIEHEICNLGRVFKRNNAPGNSIRWLLYPQGGRKVSMQEGRLLVYIDRSQLVPGIFDEKQITMSERQITRNIRNRLWNRSSVKCVSIDDTTYVGEILLVPR